MTIRETILTNMTDLADDADRQDLDQFVEQHRYLFPQPYVDDALASLWTALHATFKEVRTYSGLSQAQLAQRLLIPRRTVESWDSRDNCPRYTKMMVADAVGMLRY